MGISKPGSSWLPQKRGNRAQARIGLLVQPIAGQIPFDADEQQLVAHVVPVTCQACGEVPLASFGNVLEAAVNRQQLGEAGLEGTRCTAGPQVTAASTAYQVDTAVFSSLAPPQPPLTSAQS